MSSVHLDVLSQIEYTEVPRNGMLLAPQMPAHFPVMAATLLTSNAIV